MHVAATQIAEAAMNQLRAAARRALREVALLNEQRPIATCSSVDGRSETGRTTADYDRIPLRPTSDRAQTLVAIHGDVMRPRSLARSLERHFELFERGRKFRRLKDGFGFAGEDDKR